MLDRTLQFLFDVQPAAPGQDIAWELSVPHALPGWLMLLLVIISGWYFVAIYRREGTLASRRYKLGLALLRWLLLVLLLLMLGGLNLRVDRRGLPFLVILIDNSQSMGISDHYRDRQTEATIRSLGRSFPLENGSRLELAQAVLLSQQRELLQGLARNHRLLVYAISASPARLGQYDTQQELEQASRHILQLEAVGRNSRLGSSLRAVLGDLSGMPPTAIVYLTDGINTDGETLEEAAAFAARKNVPLYAVGIGDPQPIRDLELRDLMVDDVVFVDDVVNLEVKLSARGIAQGKATVHLHKQGQKKPLASRQVDLPDDERPVTVRLQHRAEEVGELVYVVEVEPVEQEFQMANNSVKRQVSVREHKLRVLIVESHPRFEFRFLKHLLERDPTVDLKVVLLEADLEHPEQDRVAISHFPTSQDELRNYDVVVFGDVNPFYLSDSQLENLSEFVLDHGGGLALLAGPRYNPMAYKETALATVIPLDLDGAESVTSGELFRSVLTAEGRDHPILRLGKDEAQSHEIFRNLPGAYWFFRSPRPKPGALPLAVHPTLMGDGGPLPIILLQQVGAGKALMLTIDSTWRWRDQVGDLYFSRFWVQALRYLSRTRLLGQTRQAQLTTDRNEYERAQSIELRVRLLDESLTGDEDDVVTVLVEGENGFERHVNVSRTAPSSRVYEGMLNDLPQGGYRAWMVTPQVEGRPPSATFRVVAPPGEFRKIEMNQSGLEQACRITGGEYFPIWAAHNLPRAIPAGRKIPLDTDPPILLWNTWPMLALFMTLLVSEWLLRKRKRML